MIDKTDPTNRDTVPAMLTPGEFVLNKEASTMFAPVIEQMNDAGLQHRAMKNMGGGITTYNTGGLVPFLKEVEGYGQPPNRDKAYQDQVGVWTIGYGRTRNADGSLIKPNQTSDKKSEESWLKVRAQKDRDATVEYGKKHGYDWNDNQIDALASFRFNIGNLDQLTDFGKRDMATITAKIPEYNQAGGKVSDGLINRRQAELNLFSGGSESSQGAQQPTTQTASAEPVPRFFSGGGADGVGSFGTIGDFFGGLTTPSVAPMASIPPQMRPKDLAPQMAAGTIDTMASSRPQMRPNTQADPVSVEQAIMQASVPQVQAAPPAPTAFDEAFKDARADMGAGGIFNFRGRDYNTNYLEEEDMVTANMGGAVYLNTGGLSIDQMARRKLQEDVDNAWFKRNERDALTKFDQANLALQAMPQRFPAPSPMQTEMDQLPRVLPGSSSQQEPSMSDQGGPNRVPPMSPPMPDINSDESLLQGSSSSVEQAFKSGPFTNVPRYNPDSLQAAVERGQGNYVSAPTVPASMQDADRMMANNVPMGDSVNDRRAAAQQRLIALRENLVTGSPEHIKVSNLITGAFTPSMTSLDELVNYNIPASIMDSNRMMVGNVPMGDGVPNMVEDIIKSRIPNPAANLDVGHPDRVAAIEAGTLEPTDADFDWEENQMRLTSDLQRNRLMQSVADEYGKTVGGDGSLKSEEQRLAAQLSGVPFIDYPPIESADIAGSLPPELTEDAVIASGLPQAKTNPTVILQVANQRQTAEDAIEQAKRDLATAEAGIRNAATAEQVAKYEEMGREAKINLTTSSADLVEAQEQQTKIDKVDAAAEADKATLTKTTKAQADAAREAALSSLGFSTGSEKKGPGATKGPMIKTGPNGTILDANGKPIVNLTPQQAITSDAAAIAKAEADRIAAAGGGKNTPEVSGAMSMLKSVFGDLFDSKELIRAAIMYLGGRATGMDGQQALAFAGKNYIARTDAKTSFYNEQATSGKWTNGSLAKFKKTRDPAHLIPIGAVYKATGVAPQAYYDKATGNMVMYEQHQQGKDGRKVWVHAGKDPRDSKYHLDHTYMTQDTFNVKSTDAYIARWDKAENDFADIITAELLQYEIPADGDRAKSNSLKKINATTDAKAVSAFAQNYDITPDAMALVIRNAMRKAGDDVKFSRIDEVNDLTPYLKESYITTHTGDKTNFMIGNGKKGKAYSEKLVSSEEFSSWLGQTQRTMIDLLPDANLDQYNPVQFSQTLMKLPIYNQWRLEDEEVRSNFATQGSPNRSGFMEYISKNLAKGVVNS